MSFVRLKAFAAFPVAVALLWSAAAQSEQPPSLSAPQAALMTVNLSSPQHAMDAFFSALNSYNVDAYGAMLTDDATLFFTGPPFPIRRVQGRSEIIKLVRPLFDGLRAKGAKGTVKPQDLEFQTWADTSVVTFHIPVGSSLDRRTFVLRRLHGQWKIAHLHASVTRDGPAPPPKSG